MIPQLTRAQAEARGIPRQALREAARHAKWRKGDLRYLLHAGQRKAFEAILGAKVLRFLLCTGRRWGKSRLMVVVCALVIVLRIMHRKGIALPAWLSRDSWLYRVVTRSKTKARVVYAAPTGEMVRDFIEPHMELLERHAPPELRPTRVNGNWQWPDGDKLVIRGCEDRKKADRLRGPEADVAVADEGGFIPILGYVVRSVLGPQLWETGGMMLMPSSPPESPDHPFVELYGEAEAKGASFRAETADAPHMSPEALARAIEDAGGAESVTWLREGRAQFAVDPTQTILPEFSQFKSVIVQEHERPAYFLPQVISDVGFIDLDAHLFCYYDFENDIDVIEDEVILEHANSQMADAAVAKKEAELWPRMKVHRRHADAQPRVRSDMSREDWQSEEDGVRRWEGVSKVRQNLRAMSNAMRVRMSRGRVRIHPRCRVTIAHCEYGRWNNDRTDIVRVFDDQHRPEHHYDALAAALYVGKHLDRLTNPFPQLMPGVSEATHYIPPHMLDSRTKLERMFRPKRGRAR